MKMEKVKKIIFSSWFKAALIGLCALILLFEFNGQDCSDYLNDFDYNHYYAIYDSYD